MALTLFCDGSLPIYQFPLGDSIQKTTYDNLDSVEKDLAINPLSFPAVAMPCTLCQVGVGEFSPGEGFHVDVYLIAVHTLTTF